MKKIIDSVLSVIYVSYFFLMLCIFHPIQWICWNVFGAKVHAKSVHVLNFFLTYGLYILGTKISYINNQVLPTDRPLIFVANHQSTYDIVGMIWFLRKYNPKFVSKIELSKGIPSISYNLKKSGAALINRKDAKQAITEIARLSRLMHQNNYSAAIFPEGTRSITGEMKPFAVGGIAALVKKCPNALIVPIVINGSRLNPSKSMFWLSSFQGISFEVLTPIEPQGKNIEEV